MFLLVAPAGLSVSGKEPYGLAVVDEAGRLERVALEKAARPLLLRGAAMAIVLVRRGGQPDAVKQLSQLGLLHDRQISPSGLYLYVSLQPHYSELRAGARFSADLPARQLEKIRNQTLNPQLRAELYQQGFVDSLGELERSLSHSLSLKDWLKGATLTFIACGTLYLVGFWDWLWATLPGRGLFWLWCLTPIARARRRRERERARLGQLHLLQGRAESLERTQQNSPRLNSVQRADLASLQEQVKAAALLGLSELAELRARLEAESRRLERLQRCHTSGSNELREAQRIFQSIRSTLKSRKKTRALLQSPEAQALEAELRQESDLRQHYSEAGASFEEFEQSELRCKNLQQRAREFGQIHGVLPRGPQVQTGWATASASSESPGYHGSSTSHYDDRSGSYDPPTSSSESWAGGDW
ncbi:MAG: hypothetical protein KF760_16750 [Candidatus Eremiobacteraeota bacterium]|nr:hypothetical protein [Candidatus Eremiobacteraeota bacterium]MCW5866497.1 hypothetical protein [Candidatus Eremiobacteraeota bacterium]